MIWLDFKLRIGLDLDAKKSYILVAIQETFWERRWRWIHVNTLEFTLTTDWTGNVTPRLFTGKDRVDCTSWGNSVLCATRCCWSFISLLQVQFSLLPWAGAEQTNPKGQLGSGNHPGAVRGRGGGAQTAVHHGKHLTSSSFPPGQTGALSVTDWSSSTVTRTATGGPSRQLPSPNTTSLCQDRGFRRWSLMLRPTSFQLPDP